MDMQGGGLVAKVNPTPMTREKKAHLTTRKTLISVWVVILQTNLKFDSLDEISFLLFASASNSLIEPAHSTPRVWNCHIVLARCFVYVRRLTSYCDFEDTTTCVESWSRCAEGWEHSVFVGRHFNSLIAVQRRSTEKTRVESWDLIWCRS